MQIFIENNVNDGDQTCITRLQWIGAPLLTSRISELKPVDTPTHIMD